MIYSLLMSAATNNTIPLPWWSYLLISLAGAVAMKLASQKHPKRDRREEHVDRDGGVEDDDDYDDDDDEEYYAMSRGGVFNAGGRRKSNLRSCLVVLLLAVNTPNHYRRVHVRGYSGDLVLCDNNTPNTWKNVGDGRWPKAALYKNVQK